MPQKIYKVNLLRKCPFLLDRVWHTISMFSIISIAHAAENTVGQAAARDIVAKINDVILFPLITLLMAVAFIIFLWGAFEYVKNADNESARETGRNHLMYGVIGMLIMLSAYAILNIAAGTFGLSGVLEDARKTSISQDSFFAPTNSIRPLPRPDRSPSNITQELGLSGFGEGSDTEDALPNIGNGIEEFHPQPRPIQPLTPEEMQLYERYVQRYSIEQLPGRTTAENESDIQALLNRYKSFGITEVVFMTDLVTSYGTQLDVGSFSQQEALCNKQGGEITLESGSTRVTSRSMYACLR